MSYFRNILIVLLITLPALIFSQQQTAVVYGTITDENKNPLSGVSITVNRANAGTISSDSGTYRIICTADRDVLLIYSHSGFIAQQIKLRLQANQQYQLNILLVRNSSPLDSVTVRAENDRTEAGRISLDPSLTLNVPSPQGGIESLVKLFVGSNNELTSQYSVRGGNYDENLVYVNDFEVFRPYLVRNGQQEGLSFINPELVKNVTFFNGGFQAKYGDKMSSVLDVVYRKPTKFAGSAYAGLLEQGLHVEGVSKNEKFTYLAGARNRDNRNLLSRQETQGNYVPSSWDVQGLFTYQLGLRASVELLANLSRTRFRLRPQFSQLTSSVFSPFFSANLGLDIFFEGQEDDRYSTNMIGLTFVHQPTPKLKLKWMAARFVNKEIEGIDITGAYLFGEREFDKSKPDYGLIVNPLGAGLYQTYARNRLNVGVWSVSHKGTLSLGKHFLQWGQSIEKQDIDDRLHEWEYLDSAGYNLPYNDNDLQLSRYAHSLANLSIIRLSGYLQDNIVFARIPALSLQAGLRYQYNDLNKEWLISPRVGLAWKPESWRKDIVFRAAAGLYHQPPFYRELRDLNGNLNRDLLAQRSYQVIAGADYQFHTPRRPYRISAEAYYKNMERVVPYDIDNVRIRYTAVNEAKAYATGMDIRLFTELVKDAESWLSIGFMRTRENLENDFYYDYTLDSLNQPVDSIQRAGGWFRRPTDRLFTAGLYLQDYLATNKNFRVYLNFLYGSNMPYNIPGSIKYRNALIIDPYIRIDIGFSALLVAKRAEKIKAPLYSNYLQNVWATLEVFNLIDRDNTISYMLIRDFSNTRFAMPNRLTPRLINLKLIARF